jgi:hypothetical protein
MAGEKNLICAHLGIMVNCVHVVFDQCRAAMGGSSV